MNDFCRPIFGATRGDSPFLIHRYNSFINNTSIVEFRNEEDVHSQRLNEGLHERANFFNFAMTLPALKARALRRVSLAFNLRNLSRATMATKATDWEASRYLRFENERTRPARDLLAQVPLAAPSRIVDLGCGPGNSTELLAARYPNAKLAGIDTSQNMLEKARTVLPNVDFELGDLFSYTPPEPVDLFYSNAVFQWLPASDRVPAIERLLSFQPQGGVFAIQVPDNFLEPSHVAMRETAAEPPFNETYAAKNTAATARETFPSPFDFYNALKPMCQRVDIWHTFYQHHLENPEAIVDWLRSTGLRPFLEPLDENHKEAFLQSYLQKIRESYPDLVDGGVLLRFPRLFVILVK